jgi:hypothetical protein
VAALNVFSILAFAEGEIDRDKVWMPLLFGILVPAGAYALGLLWEVLRKRGQSPIKK